MDLNRANIEVLFQNFRIEWTDAFNAATEKTIYEQVAMVVPSTGATTLHAWLNQIPIMREWLGDRVVNNVQSNSLVITNRKFESTIEMTREEIEDDLYGMYTPLVRLMAEDAAAHPDRLLVDALVTNDNWAGDATPAPFFGTSRAYGTGTIANYVTTALSKATYETARITMGGYLGHKDQPLMVAPDVLLHGPANEPLAFDLLKNAQGGVAGASGTDGSAVQVSGQNRNFGTARPILSRRLVGTYANYWFLLGTQGGIRGLVYQERKAAEFQNSRLSDNSDFVFQHDKYQMGCRARGAAFKALPHLIYAGYNAA